MDESKNEFDAFHLKFTRKSAGLPANTDGTADWDASIKEDIVQCNALLAKATDYLAGADDMLKSKKRKVPQQPSRPDCKEEAQKCV